MVLLPELESRVVLLVWLLLLVYAGFVDGEASVSPLQRERVVNPGSRTEVDGEGVDDDVEVRMRTVRGRRGRSDCWLEIGVEITVAEGKRTGAVLVLVLVRGRFG